MKADIIIDVNLTHLKSHFELRTLHLKKWTFYIKFSWVPCMVGMAELPFREIPFCLKCMISWLYILRCFFVYFVFFLLFDCQAMKILHERGTKTVVITSSELGDNKTLIALGSSVNGEFWLFLFIRLQGKAFCSLLET